MKKICYIAAMLSLVAVTIEALPGGAVLIFSDGISHYTETFSYFSMMPFGYANFGPLLTAVGTCVILVLALIGMFTGRNPVKAIRILAIAATVTSVMPLMYGFAYCTVSGFVITAILAAIVLVTFKPDWFNGCSCC